MRDFAIRIRPSGEVGAFWQIPRTTRSAIIGLDIFHPFVLIENKIS
jgi:hypothetical protein